MYWQLCVLNDYHWTDHDHESLGLQSIASFENDPPFLDLLGQGSQAKEHHRRTVDLDLVQNDFRGPMNDLLERKDLESLSEAEFARGIDEVYWCKKDSPLRLVVEDSCLDEKVESIPGD